MAVSNNISSTEAIWKEPKGKTNILKIHLSFYTEWKRQYELTFLS